MIKLYIVHMKSIYVARFPLILTLETFNPSAAVSSKPLNVEEKSSVILSLKVSKTVF